MKKKILSAFLLSVILMGSTSALGATPFDTSDKFPPRCGFKACPDI
ncbi:hypothetical protein MHH33_16685 [Paenisporosarcina sp. FSL H8-0542]|nr:hypothetical protein [Paenisporosarcina sp. HGH0030]EPD51548.1 hypothetical protein HMPREF1210_02146 [Paenisporosarcina sp. HGH0030]